MKHIMPIFLLLCGCASQVHEKYFPDGVLADESDLDSFVQSWYGKHLASMKELPLISMDTRQYRFTWLPTFNRPMVFRISVEHGNYFLYVKSTDGAGGYEPGKIIHNKKLTLSIETATALISKLENDCKFWEQPTRLDDLGLDGSQWIFEAINDKNYHVVDRWSPNNGCFYDFGIELMSLSKVKISEIY